MFQVVVERTVRVPAAGPCLSDILPDLLASWGYAGIRRNGGSGTARMHGGLFPLNPHEVRHRLQWSQGEGGETGRLAAVARTLPWMGPRVRTLLEGRLERLEQRLVKAGALAGAPGPPTPPARPTPSRSLAALGSFLLSLLLGTLLAVLVNLVYGYGLIQETVAYLTAKAELLAPFAPLSVPPPAQLESLPLSFRLGCGLFFALTFGYGVGLVGSCLLLLGELWRPMARLSVWIVLVGAAALAVNAYRAESTLLCVACAAALPLSILLGYSIGWAFRGAPPTSRSRVRYAGILIVAAWLAAQAVATGKERSAGSQATGRVRDFVEIRDRLLLGNAWGRWVSDFYYAHTLYPAEAIRPMIEKPERAVLLLSPKAKPPAGMRGTLEAGSSHAIHMESLEEVLATVRDGGVDLVLLDTEAPGVEELLRGRVRGKAGADLLARSLVYGPADRVAALCARESTAFRPPCLALPTNPARLREALREISARLDRHGPLRRSVGLSLGVGLASLWLGWNLVGLGLVLAPAGIALAVGDRRWHHRWPAGRVVLSLLGLAATGWLGYRSLGPPPPERAAILEIRAHRGDPFHADTLCAHLADPDDDVRYEAAYGLWHAFARGGRVAGACLESLLRAVSDPDPRVRTWAARDLSRARGARAQEALIQALRDPVVNVRYTSAEVLGQIGDERALRAIEERLGEGDTWYVVLRLWSARRALLHRLDG